MKASLTPYPRPAAAASAPKPTTPVPLAGATSDVLRPAPVPLAGAASDVLLQALVAPANVIDKDNAEEQECNVIGMGDELTRAPRSVLWTSTGNDEDGEEVLAPQTPPGATKALEWRDVRGA